MQKLRLFRIITFPVVFTFFIVSAKTARGQFKIIEKPLYSITENDPEKAKNLHLGLYPLFIDMNALNFALGAAANLQYNFRNKINLSANYYYAYADRAASAEYGFSAETTSPAINKSLVGTYYYTRKLFSRTETPFNVTDGSISRGMPIELKRLWLFGVRGGIHSVKTNILNYGNAMKLQGYFKDSSASKIVDLQHDRDYSTMMEMNMISVGISRTTIRDYVLDVRDIGKVSNKEITELYFDAFYAPAIVYSNMNYYVFDGNKVGRPDYYEVVINEHTPRSRIGGRVGYNIILNNVTGFFGGAELGIRPGQVERLSNVYFMLRIGYGLSLRI